MAGPEAASLPQLLQAFNFLTRRMLEDARGARWDEMLAQQPAWLALQGALGDIDWESYAEVEREALRALLLDTQAAIEELTGLAEAWRPQLATMLNGIHNSSRLRSAYRL
ncbi:flagellar protein FliT [Chitiniphilus purpureus]|uniref:Flagellar protein FliT n=1 Tax=Chitiniphilus purpureus TaxID=2981137 RepID=A0ABY6DH92_9NEIS|nr:flagellar protein FliT [Chitiniphilus sp. CD1]UXY13709.1 flagellar protein FliT [Chitiniphilus sp. CD1]